MMSANRTRTELTNALSFAFKNSKQIRCTIIETKLANLILEQLKNLRL